MNLIVQTIEPDDVPLDEMMLYGADAKKGLVREYSVSINEDGCTADLLVTTWTRNTRRTAGDQRGEILGQHALATFTGLDLYRLQAVIGMTLLHLDSYPKTKEVDA